MAATQNNGLLGYRRLLVPLNGTPEAEAALEHAVLQARAFGATLHLVRVVSPPAANAVAVVELPAGAGLTAPLAAGVPPEDDPAAIGAAIYLEDVARRLGAQGMPVETAVREGPVAATILAEAAVSEADLIVISADTPRSGLARLVLGSVADEILRRAPCPVLHVHAPVRSEAPPLARVRSFAEDLAQAGPTTPVSLGLRIAPVDRIVGSVGRAHELDAGFLPRDVRRRHDPRFRRVRDAMREGRPLPPLQLYKLGYDYYVLDGHHRVAAARELGIGDLEAEVTEYLSASDGEQQHVFAQRRDFERITGLTRVGAARAGTYPRLLQMIQRYAEEQRRGRLARGPEDAAGERPAGGEEPLPDVARRWYYRFCQPMAQRIRARRLGRSFPGERTADILARLADFRAEEARLGHELSWEAALDHFAAAYGRAQPRRIWDLRRFVPHSHR